VLAALVVYPGAQLAALVGGQAPRAGADCPDVQLVFARGTAEPPGVNRLTAGVHPEEQSGVPPLGDRHRRHPVRGPFGIAGQHGVWPHPPGDRSEGSAETRAPDLLRAFPDNYDSAGRPACFVPRAKGCDHGEELAFLIVGPTGYQGAATQARPEGGGRPARPSWLNR